MSKLNEYSNELLNLISNQQSTTFNQIDFKSFVKVERISNDERYNQINGKISELSLMTTNLLGRLIQNVELLIKSTSSLNIESSNVPTITYSLRTDNSKDVLEFTYENFVNLANFLTDLRQNNIISESLWSELNNGVDPMIDLIDEISEKHRQVIDEIRVLAF